MDRGVDKKLLSVSSKISSVVKRENILLMLDVCVNDRNVKKIKVYDDRSMTTVDFQDF